MGGRFLRRHGVGDGVRRLGFWRKGHSAEIMPDLCMTRACVRFDLGIEIDGRITTRRETP